MFEIRIKDLMFKASLGNTILDCAKESDILIEHSCLNGRCSSCKAKVLEGTSEPISDEIGLTREEREQNFILTCVRKATSNLVLDLDVIFGIKLEKPRTLPTKIYSLSFISSDIIRVSLRFPPNIDFKFMPGQYVNIINRTIKRSYSIGGVESGNMLVFYIKKYDYGLMSIYFFNEAKENDLLRIEGPLGSFFLRDNSLENVVFLATGTGIAPILSILQSDKNKDLLNTRNVFLFHGGRSGSDLIESDFLKNSVVTYFPTLSKVKTDDYYFGYIQNILLQQNLDLSNTTVYACGSNKMIEESKLLLILNGLQLNQFYSDAFIESN